MESIDSKITLIGNVDIKIYDEKTGEIKHSECRQVRNKVVTTGANFIASRMVDTSATVMTQMKLGDSGTAAVIAQNALQGTVLGTSSVTATNTSGTNVVTYQATFAAGNGTGAVQEAGIFNASNVMLARTAFSVVNKSSTDAMAITWTITVTVS